MESLTAQLHLTLSDLERSKSRSPRFQSVISHKGAKLGPMLLLTINMKQYISPMTFDFGDLERWSLTFQSRISRKGAELEVTINHQ